MGTAADYVVERVLGRGGYGVVWLARDRAGRAVALKRLLGLDERQRERFRREQRLLREASGCDGVVPLLDAGEDGQGPWLVMPFLGRGSLRDRLRGGQLPDAEARAVALALARATGALHALGVVHRDLKPENVLFDDAGRPLVADLGLGFRTDGPGDRSVALSVTGEFKGTFGYAAPEQLRADRAVGPPTDVFALGVILYELLHGERPFRGASIHETMANLLAGSREPTRADLPPDLARAIERALARDPTRRPRDGAALAALLEEGAGGARRGPPMVALAAGLVALLAVGAAVVAVTVGRPRPPAPVAPTAPTAPTAPVAPVAPAAPTEPVAPTAQVATEPLPVPPPPAPYPAGPSQDELERRLDEGVAAAIAGDVERAFARASGVLEVEPDNAVARLLRAEAAAKRGDRALALADADLVLAADPDSAAALRLRGELRHEAGEPGAREDLERAATLRPDAPDFLVSRAIVREAQGERAGARADLERALALAPDDAHAHRRLAELLRLLGEKADALRHADRALALEPGHPYALSTRAILRLGKDDAGAAADADLVLALEPRSVRALQVGCLARYRLDELEPAGALADRLLREEPDNVWGLTVRSAAAAARGASAEALADLDHLLRLKPDSPDRLLERARLRWDAGRRDEALADVERSVTIAPKHAEARLQRGLWRRERGDAEGARADAAAALELGLDEVDGPRARALLAP